MNRDRHWENVYKTKSPEEMSWYEPHLATSLEWILEAAPSHSSSIIDVGGGASTLADDLHARGFRSLTVLDISPTAIARSQERLGTAAGDINWIIGDVTHCSLPDAAFDIWHDRAVFHFLTEQEEKASYVKQLANSMKPSGQVIIATFSINGPRSCSGLTVSRYDTPSLQKEFGADFKIVKSETITHQTPSGAVQEFLYYRIART
jgi:2-polyprenyl-3-methyl-5-hydroxy-6-metoxy-1,4-benzoquinol methylase